MCGVISILDRAEEVARREGREPNGAACRRSTYLQTKGLISSLATTTALFVAAVYETFIETRTVPIDSGFDQFRWNPSPSYFFTAVQCVSSLVNVGVVLLSKAELFGSSQPPALGFYPSNSATGVGGED